MSDFTLLVVDDVEEMRESLVMAFELKGYTVLSAESGAAAIELVRTKKVDFILSDVRMPAMDGVHLLQEIRKIHPEIPVFLLMSGYTDVTPEQVKAMGAIGLITKPFDLSKVVEAIEAQRAAVKKR